MSARSQHLTVVMPVLNARPYLDDSIGSILRQTYADFEFVILDDGSTDGTTEALQSWADRDSRIRLHIGERNLGPAASSNWVVEQAKTDLVARMDADDISKPERLRRQVELFAAHPNLVLTGTLFEHIDDRGKRVLRRDRTLPTRASFNPPFAHGSIMFRRDAFQRAGGYRPQCDYWEDADLYLRLARQGRVLVLLEDLFLKRFNPNNSRLTAEEKRIARSLNLLLRCRREFEAGRDYEPLVAAAVEPGAEEKLEPEVMQMLTGLRLFAGVKPAVPHRLWRKTALRRDRESARALAYGAWAMVSPRSLRLYGRFKSLARQMVSRRAVTGRTIHEWRPFAD